MKLKRPTAAPCAHNQRRRHHDGFLCEDCRTFFPDESPSYRSDESLFDLWMTFHNINAAALQAGKPPVTAALQMRDRIGVRKQHKDYEALITEAETLLATLSDGD